MGLKVPIGQSLHTDALVAGPAASDDVPASHLLHSDLPEPEYEPGLQNSHADEPSFLEKLPASHGVHVSVVRLVEKEPGSQFVHDVAPRFRFDLVPLGQRVQFSAPQFEKYPTLHSEQYKPSVPARQDVGFAEGEKVTIDVDDAQALPRSLAVLEIDALDVFVAESDLVKVSVVEERADCDTEADVELVALPVAVALADPVEHAVAVALAVALAVPVNV